MSEQSQIARLGLAALGLGVVAAAMWFAWLGWDHEYYLVDGVAQGPYRPWQVIGCGLSVAAAAVLARVWVRRGPGTVLLAAAGVVGFAVPWSVDAARTDETGMWGVGLVYLLIGGGIGLVATLSLTSAALRMLRSGARS